MPRRSGQRRLARATAGGVEAPRITSYDGRVKADLAILLLTAIFHTVLVAAVVIPFGWDAMNWFVEIAILTASISIAVLTVRLSEGQAPED